MRNVVCISAGTVQEYQFSWEAFHLLVSFDLSAMAFRTFAKKTSVEFVKAAFNVSAEKVRREPLPFGKITTFFFLRTFVDCFSAGFSKLPPTCPEDSFEEFFWNSFSFEIGFWAKTFQTLEYKASPLLSKQHSICLEDQLWKIYFFGFFVVP